MKHLVFLFSLACTSSLVAAELKLPNDVAAAHRRQSPPRTAPIGMAKEPTTQDAGNCCDQCCNSWYQCCVRPQLDLSCWGCCIGVLYGICFECSSCCRSKK